MAEYRLESGSVIDDTDIDRICDEFESESWEGSLERVHLGPASECEEPWVSVSVDLPQSMLDAIDARSTDRPGFIRAAVAAALELSSSTTRHTDAPQ